MDIGSFPHQVTRLVFDTGQPYEEFRARYEAAVPALDEKRLAEFAARGAAWSEVVADAGASAPHGFLIFWRLDTTPVMSLAGDPARCTAYLMGNQTIAEQMYRHDPSVMLYAPLRTAIYIDCQCGGYWRVNRSWSCCRPRRFASSWTSWPTASCARWTVLTVSTG